MAARRHDRTVGTGREVGHTESQAVTLEARNSHRECLYWTVIDEDQRRNIYEY
jgi:hypothetical protein